MAGCDWEHNGEWVREGSPEAYTQSAQQSAEMAAASARDAAKSAEDTSATLAQANQDMADALASAGPIVQQEVINNRELLLQLTTEARDQAVTDIQTAGQSNVSTVNDAGGSQVCAIGTAADEAKADLLAYKGQLADDLAPLVSAAEACRDAACACSVNAAASEGNAGRSATAAETSAANANASAQAAQASEAAAAASQTAAARDAQSIGNAAAQIEANRLAVAAEASRAQGVESALSVDIAANDTALRALIAEEVAKYLPLSGGTMSGDIKFSPATWLIQAINNVSDIFLEGGSAWNQGGFLRLNGGSQASQPGWFQLGAYKDGSGHSLVGKPNGRIEWAGKVIRPCTANHNTTDTWIPVCSTEDGMDVFDYVLKSEIARSGSYTYNSGSTWGQFQYNICSNFWIEAGWNTGCTGNLCRFSTPVYKVWIDIAGWPSGTSTSNWAPGIRSNGENFVEVFSSERNSPFYFIRIGTR